STWAASGSATSCAARVPRSSPRVRPSGPTLSSAPGSSPGAPRSSSGWRTGSLTSPNGGEMPLDDQRAHRFAEKWYAAWNSHDLDAILDHYADEVEMASPLVSRLTGRDDGRIVGKDALSAYFAAGLERYPDLHFEPIE